MKRKICVSAFLALTCLCLFSGVMLLQEGLQRKHEKEANLLLAEKVRPVKGGRNRI